MAVASISVYNLIITVSETIDNYETKQKLQVVSPHYFSPDDIKLELCLLTTNETVPDCLLLGSGCPAGGGGDTGLLRPAPLSVSGHI